MDRKQQAIVENVRECLNQIALELESAADGARKAASNSGEGHKAAWGHVQQMYSRLEQATHLAGKFQKTINDALAERDQ